MAGVVVDGHDPGNAMKPTGASQRVFRDPTPALPYRKVRRSRREVREESGDQNPRVKFHYREVPEGKGQREMKIAPMVKLGGSLSPKVDLKSVRWGGFLGLIAIGFVLNLWMGVMLSIIYQLLGWDPTCWSDWTGGSFVIALYGVHLFGIAGHSLSQGYRSWGVMAIVAFWIGLLGWIPVGIVISWLTR